VPARSMQSVLVAAGGVFVLLLVTLTLSGVGRAQTADAGKALFEKRCGGCHALDRDKEGPRLRGVYQRVAGSTKSFQYSEALKNSKIVWTEEMLDRWLTDPEKLVPNNDMSFQVGKADERKEIIAFLKQ
jgi:cytochrome c